MHSGTLEGAAFPIAGGARFLCEAQPHGLDVRARRVFRGGGIAKRGIGKAIARGRNFKGYACDFSNRSVLIAFSNQVKQENPRINILINNAGTILRKPAVEHPEEYWDQVIETNLGAEFHVSREIGKDMLAEGSGKIIFAASLRRFHGGINVPGYAASKGGIGQLTKALGNEWAGRGVNVNAIAPGYIDTDNTEALRNDPWRNQAILSRIPAGRWGNPDDLKGAAVYLASEAEAYVHGAVLLVDGGWIKEFGTRSL